MEKVRRNDFVVNSKGHCFVCLNKVFNKSNVNSTGPEKESSSTSSLHTLHCLAQYLKVDMTRVFSQKGSIPASLLAEVKQSRLKVELCEECASLAKRFSNRFQQWEKLDIEMQADLDHIQKKLLTAGQPEGRFMKSEEDQIKEVLAALRMETIDKCASKLGNQAPRIKIQKLTKEKIKFMTTRKSMKTSIDTGLIFQSDVKMESRNEVDVEDSGNAFANDNASDERSDDDNDNRDDFNSMEQSEMMNTVVSDVSKSPRQEHCNSPDVTRLRSTSGESLELNRTINLVTGRYKCNLGLKEFGRSGFQYHFQSVHLNIRYKCNLCERMFTHKPDYNSHLKRDHLGVTYKCLTCNQEFKYKSSLNSHQRKNMCLPGNDELIINTISTNKLD